MRKIRQLQKVAQKRTAPVRLDVLHLSLPEVDVVPPAIWLNQLQNTRGLFPVQSAEEVSQGRVLQLSGQLHGSPGVQPLGDFGQEKGGRDPFMK